MSWGRREIMTLMGMGCVVLWTRPYERAVGDKLMPRLGGPAETDEESWRALLSEMAVLAIGDEDIRAQLSAEQIERKWLGEAPATDADIYAAEERLRISLPPSYKAFLKVSNGWHWPNPFVSRVRPVAAIAPFVEQNGDWARAFSEGSARYGAPAADDPNVDLPATIQISDFDPDKDDAVMMLNPRSVSASGEMAGWFFGNWVPGAEVLPSFWHLMVNQRDSMRYMAEQR